MKKESETSKNYRKYVKRTGDTGLSYSRKNDILNKPISSKRGTSDGNLVNRIFLTRKQEREGYVNKKPNYVYKDKK